MNFLTAGIKHFFGRCRAKMWNFVNSKIGKCLSQKNVFLGLIFLHNEIHNLWNWNNSEKEETNIRKKGRISVKILNNFFIYWKFLFICFILEFYLHLVSVFLSKYYFKILSSNFIEQFYRVILSSNFIEQFDRVILSSNFIE